MLELMRFRLVPGADVSAFLAADKRLQSDFAYQQPGLLRRTTARGADGRWVVVDVWRSAADADACAAQWDSDDMAGAFMAFVDRSTVESERYEELE
jgi:hypothetical protein